MENNSFLKPDQTPSIDISIVVPLLNEEKNVELMYSRIVEAMTQIPDESFELIFVDDGSTDATFQIIQQLSQSDSRLKGVRFRRNFGQTPAMVAGFHYASGRTIVTMDGDLQNDPLDIPRLIAEIEKGADLVAGWRQNRQDAFVSRKIPSVVANRLIGRITGVRIRDNGCSLKAYRAGLIKQLPLYSEMHRFIPAVSSIAGANVVQIPVRHHARQFGESKYGLSRIYRVLFDLVAIKTTTRFSAYPMQWFGLLSIPFIFLASTGILAWIIWHGAVSLTVNLLLIGLSLSCATTAGFFIICGALAELSFKTGSTRPSDFLRLTARVIKTEGT